MKSSKVRVLTIVMIAFVVLCCAKKGMAQKENEIKDYAVLTGKQLTEKFNAFKRDPGFTALLAEVTRKGFGKITDQKDTRYAWGFTGKWEADKSVSEVIICGFDFVSKKGEACTMLWGKVGDKIYKTYMVFPADKKGLEALGSAQEWYADSGNKVQLAHSLKSCLRNWIEDHCSSWCERSNKDCLSAATTKRTVEIELGGMKITTTTTSFSLSAFVSCVAASCSSCISLGLVSCALSN